jgi:anti-sigma regulatory factor (Ser/Thr protein kinase)
MPDGLPASIRLLVPSDLVYVRPVRKMVEGLLYGQGWVEDDVDAALIITEIVQNAVEHGSRADGTEAVSVEVHVLGDALDIRVIDPGTGEDPHGAVDRDVETRPSMEDPRGRGLFLINRLAVSFERVIDPGGGLCIRARKVAAAGEMES